MSSNSQSLNISDIPPEILLIIIEKLDFRSMITLTEVSTMWNALISNSMKFLRTTKLHLQAHNLVEFDRNSYNFARKYQMIMINGFWNVGEQLNHFEEAWVIQSVAKIILNLRENLKIIHFHELNFFTPNKFASIIYSCDALEELKLVSCIVPFPYSPKAIVPLPKLKVLDLQKPGIGIAYFMFGHFECENLETLDTQTNDYAREVLVEFLNNCKALKELRLSMLDLCCDEQVIPQFKLKKLTLRYNREILTHSERTLENWRALINSTEPDSTFVFKRDATCYQQMYSVLLNMIEDNSNITKLECDIPNSARETLYEKFIVLIQPNWEEFRYIKTLHARLFSTNRKSLNFLAHFPNVETLVLDFYKKHSEILDATPIVLKNLINLSIKRDYESFVGLLELPKMQKLTWLDSTTALFGQEGMYFA